MRHGNQCEVHSEEANQANASLFPKKHRQARTDQVAASFTNVEREVRPTPRPDRSVDEGQSLQTRSAEVFLGLVHKDTEHHACHGDAMMHSGRGEKSKTKHAAPRSHHRLRRGRLAPAGQA